METRAAAAAAAADAIIYRSAIVIMPSHMG